MRKELEQAKALLEQEGCTCVLRKANISYASKERGITPLLQWLDTGMNFCEAAAADKVVGKAAAYLYVLLQVSDLYAYVISQPALDVLERHGIRVIYEALVPAIRNRTNTGFCPMESAVLDVNEPTEALLILREKRSQMLKQMAQQAGKSVESEKLLEK